MQQVERAQVFTRLAQGVVDVARGADVGLDGGDFRGKAGAREVAETGDHDAIAARVEQFRSGVAHSTGPAGDERTVGTG
jgi:hypothetical protein